MANSQFVFLVSGQPHNVADNTFANLAWLRVRELVKVFNRDLKKAGAPVRTGDDVSFIHFCCHTSADKKYPRVETYNHSFAKVHDAPARAKWTALADPKSFIEWQPIRDAAKVDRDHALSIVNVYHSIRRAPAASVLELSILAHAFVEGPVLTGTDAIAGRTTRTPGDTDGRAAIDFTDSMGEDPKVELGPYVDGQPPPSGGKGPGKITAIRQFGDAFAPGGTIRVWGCNIQDIVFTTAPGDSAPSRCLILSTPRQVIEEAFKRPLTKGGLKGARLPGAKRPKGSTMIRLDMGAQMRFERQLQADRHAGSAFTPFDEARLLDVHYNAVPDATATTSPNIEFFRPAGMGGTLDKVIDRSLSEIAKFTAGVMMSSYGFRAAKALPHVTVFTGAPGTSSDLSDTVQMHIEPARVTEARFFEWVTGTPLDDEASLRQRHFSRLDATAVTAIEDVHTNGLP
jgi:hypothetical protein